MIEVLFRDTGSAVIVGEAEDLEGISMLRVDPKTCRIDMELVDATSKPLGELNEQSVKGLEQADSIIVAALYKNTLAWAVEVDLNDFKEPPRKVTQIELTALIQGMAETGYYGDAANEIEQAAGRRKRKERNRVS